MFDLRHNIEMNGNVKTIQAKHVITTKWQIVTVVYRILNFTDMSALLHYLWTRKKRRFVELKVGRVPVPAGTRPCAQCSCAVNSTSSASVLVSSSTVQIFVPAEDAIRTKT